MSAGRNLAFEPETFCCLGKFCELSCARGEDHRETSKGRLAIGEFSGSMGDVGLVVEDDLLDNVSLCSQRAGYVTDRQVLFVFGAQQYNVFRCHRCSPKVLALPAMQQFYDDHNKD